MTEKTPKPEIAEDVHCNLCGAKPGERCHTVVGGARHAHGDRQDILREEQAEWTRKHRRYASRDGALGRGEELMAKPMSDERLAEIRHWVSEHRVFASDAEELLVEVDRLRELLAKEAADS